MKYISFLEHEAASARLERTIKRLWILALSLFAAFVVSNAAWIFYKL